MNRAESLGGVVFVDFRQAKRRAVCAKIGQLNRQIELVFNAYIALLKETSGAALPKASLAEILRAANILDRLTQIDERLVAGDRTNGEGQPWPR